MDPDSSPGSPQSSNSNSVAVVLTACAISVLLIFLVYSENFVFGSKAGNWIYPYFETIPSFPISIALIVLLLLGLSIFMGSRLIDAHEEMVLLGCFLIAVFIQYLIRRVYPFSLGSIVQSDQANSFYTPAMRFSALEILTKYNSLASAFSAHARSNMPGKLLFFELLKLLTSSPQRMGYLIIGFSTLGALLLYGICKRLFHDRKTAFFAFILYALIPSKLFFLPLLNTVTPVLMLLCFYLFIVFIDKKQVLIAWILGVALYLLILFEPSPLVIGIVLVGILLHAFRERKVSNRDLWRLIIALSLGFLSVYLIFSVFFSFDLLSILQSVLKDAANFNFTDQRDYTIWVGENLKEFFYVAGIPVMIIFIYMTAHILSQWITSENTDHWSLENVFVVSLLITFLVVVFLGLNRGEITRLWIYLAVLFQVPAAIFIAKIEKAEFPFYVVASTLVLQSIITLNHVGFIIP